MPALLDKSMLHRCAQHDLLRMVTRRSIPPNGNTFPATAGGQRDKDLALHGSSCGYPVNRRTLPRVVAAYPSDQMPAVWAKPPTSTGTERERAKQRRCIEAHDAIESCRGVS